MLYVIYLDEKTEYIIIINNIIQKKSRIDNKLLLLLNV